MSRPSAAKFVVVGAGAFGGWTALNLLRAGARVSLLEARGAGNALSGSGGESRVIRHVYAQRRYVDLARRSLELWQRADREWGRGLFHQKGVLFMSRGSGPLPEAAQHLRAAGVEFERLDRPALRTRFPQINTDDIEDAIFEPGAGYIDARRACEAVRDVFVAEGGDYRIGTVTPGVVRNGEMEGVHLSDGASVRDGQFVFACGAWLKTLLPGVLGSALAVTRQEVYFFRTPAGCVAELNGQLPVWADLVDEFWYGVPDSDGRFKIANDGHGPAVDPETMVREATPRGIEQARAHMEWRFPGMHGALYLDARVCQYCSTPDHDFILDRLPGAGNAWLMGAGSGHGFKHGPAMGEVAAACILGKRSADPAFGLGRLAATAAGA